MTNRTIVHPLAIGDHVAYWHNGEPRSGTIRYFTNNRQRIFIKDDRNTVKELRSVPARLVTYQPLEAAA